MSYPPLIVFIKTVGISQKKILQNSLDICTGRRKFIYTHCAICRVPAPSNDPYYYETNSPFLCTLTTEIISVRALSSCPVLDLKKAFFLLFVVFIQLPMVCVTFSEKSYSVPIHTCAHSKSLPLAPPILHTY